MSRWRVRARLRQAIENRLAEPEPEWLDSGEDFDMLDLAAGAGLEGQELPVVHEINPFLDEMEEMICSAPTLPMTSKALVDQEHCLAALDGIRANWPLEVLEAQRVLAAQAKVLQQAEVEAETIRQRAERKAAMILEQSQLIRVAEVRAEEIIDAAEQEAEKMLDRAHHDVSEVYVGLERELDLLVRDIKELVGARLAKTSRQAHHSER
jgi:hypothetical protein